MTNFDDFKLAIEALSGSKNTVLLDDLGMPSVMVAFPKLKNSDIISGGSSVTHPAFIVDGVEKDKIYISKYQNIVINSRAYSLPGRDPQVNINFDTAVADCRNKGKGWSLMPYSAWAAVALWSRKNGTMPRGNNNYGQDISYPLEKGVATSYDNSKVGRTATGSGPATWCHNWLPDGIADLNGNIWEWCAGMRLNAGEINIVENTNVFNSSVSLAASSDAWKAINASGEIVAQGTDGSLKYDYLSSKITLINGTVTDTSGTGRGTEYKSLGLADGLTAPELAKALILYPDEPNGDYGGDNRWATLAGERVPLCGGVWGNGARAGVFLVSLSGPRSNSDGALGFRSAYCEL